jgi:transcriptional regulator with XRE-family HTH domain
MRGWSQTELADRTGLQPSAISHFEDGRRVPSAANLLNLSKALATSCDYLLGGLLDDEPMYVAIKQFARAYTSMTPSDQRAILKMADVLAHKKRIGKTAGCAVLE